MENKKLSALFICGLIWVSLLAGCSKQNEFNENLDRPEFGWANDESINGSGWRMQGPRNRNWPRRWIWSGEMFSGENRNEMFWNLDWNWAKKRQEASLPTNGKLTVLNTCIGCGKCVRIAGSNFEMKWWISVMKSQENISSQSVNMAMQVCPVDAIVIEA